MIRDDKMMQLVASDKEPITPFVRTVRSLYQDCGVSSILVIGGTGDYFDVADNILVMDCYKCFDATDRAKVIVANSRASASQPQMASQSVEFRPTKRVRTIAGSAFVPNGKVKTLSENTISYGETELDLSSLEQLVTKAQTTAISNALQRLPHFTKRGQSIRETINVLEQRLDRDGLDVLAPGQCNGSMARPRKYEIAGAINRLRRPNAITQG
jgi:predicted ABC-class ATPase